MISFAGGLPAPELFDLDGIRAAYDEALGARAVLQYSTSEGNPALREEVARQYTDDDLPTSASDIIVTKGSQQGLGLLSTSLLDPGDVILVEEPFPATLPAGSTWNRPDGGMFVWALLPEGMDATAALAAALRRDVAFVPGAPFFAGRADDRALRLSFTTYSPERIRAGLSRLGAAFGEAG